uniref:non-specific serine/threonine protein kinase n=1 Tax=Oryza glumipatula TaxID=40148 RepID=A0A0D9YKF4_9ORYZ
MAKPLDLPLLLIPVMVVTLISVSFAQTNVTSGASVQAVAGAGWSSPSGHFVFGFYATDGGLAVGVWLATAPSITVTWTASRNDTPATGGALRLTYDGRLLWTGANGQDRTVAAPPQPAVAAAMRDDGNFVLYAANATVAWSTFAAPTDTLLAGQDLAPGAQLFSSVSATSRATGKYRLTNQLNDGNLVMYPAGTMNVAAAAYWDTGTFQIGFPLTLRLDASGVLYLVGNNGSYTKNLTKASAAQAVEQAHYHRVTLDPDGVLRSYRHGLLSSGGWKTDVEWIGPSDWCHVKGACGFNSYCVLDRDAQPSCLCPPGFDLIDAGDAAGGCTASSGAGECTAGQRADPGSSMATMQNVSWADTPCGVLAAGTSAADCQAACMSDCFCVAALLDTNDGTCTKQQLPLRYGRAGGGYTMFVKTGGAASPALGGGGGGNHHHHRLRRASTVALVCVGLLTFVALCALLASARLLWLNQRMVRRRVALADAEALDEEAPLRSYSYEELEHATYSFRHPLGRGAFGTVFKGTLRRGGERAVAVKRLEKLVEDGEREFQWEVRAIGRTSHRNLVRLLGFCHEGANRLLLDSRVIHCDVKPQNILMDAAGTAKISDFGLAKLLQPDQTRTFTGVRGTRGYLAPEWYRGAGPVTVKADVYSYGVVLLETVACRRSMEMEEAAGEEERTLAEWAYEWLLVKGEAKSAMSSDETVEAAEVERVVKVAMWCVQAEPQSRPSMDGVILMLQGRLEVPFPPPPPASS